MLRQCCHTEWTGRVPKSYGALTSTSSIHISWVICNFSGLKNKSFLVENITLRFPLPNYQLSKLLYSQSQPSTRVVDCYRTNLMLSNWERLNCLQILTNEPPDAKFAISMSTGQKTHVRLKNSSFQETSLIQWHLFAKNEPAIINFLLKLGKKFFIFLNLFTALPSNVIPGSFLSLSHVLVCLSSLLDPFPNKKIASSVDRVKICHVVRKYSRDYLITMSLKSDGQIIFDREQIVQKNNVVLPTSNQKSTVLRKLHPTNVGTVSRLVFFKQNQRLKTSVETATFINSKTLLLPYS